MNRGSLSVIVLFFSLLLCSLFMLDGCEWVALALMICAGIPHGSFDLRVAEAKWQGSPRSRGKIFAMYIGSVLAMAGLCVFLPFIGLSLFLVVSLIHFSEGEINATVPPSGIIGSLFAISAILLPIGLHPDLAQLYLRFFVPRDLLAAMEKPLLILASLAALVVGSMLLYTIYRERGAARAEAVQRVLCLSALVILPPLSGFAVWFIGRHSRQHLEVCHALFTEGQFRVPIDFLLISALAIVGLFPFTLLFDFSRIEEMFAAAICLIAGLTLPHMVVSHRIHDLRPS